MASGAPTLKHGHLGPQGQMIYDESGPDATSQTFYTGADGKVHATQPITEAPTTEDDIKLEMNAKGISHDEAKKYLSNLHRQVYLSDKMKVGEFSDADHRELADVQGRQEQQRQQWNAGNKGLPIPDQSRSMLVDQSRPMSEIQYGSPEEKAFFEAMAKPGITKPEADKLVSDWNKGPKPFTLQNYGGIAVAAPPTNKITASNTEPTGPAANLAPTIPPEMMGLLQALQTNRTDPSVTIPPEGTHLGAAAPIVQTPTEEPAPVKGLKSAAPENMGTNWAAMVGPQATKKFTAPPTTQQPISSLKGIAY